jgi:uncharacterized protein (TIGR00369 family)
VTDTSLHSPPSSPDDWLNRLRTLGPDMMRLSAYARELGADLASVERGRARLELPYKDAFVGDPDTGVIAGGIVTALLDTACGYAVWSALPEFQSIATLDLRIDYMRPARPREVLKAEAECYKLGRSIAFVRALAFETDAADPVAAAQGAFILNSDGGRKAGANLAKGARA